MRTFVAVLLSVFLISVAVEGSAFAQQHQTSTGLSKHKKEKGEKGAKKKHKKGKKGKRWEKKNSIALKGFVVPMSDMNVESTGGTSTDADMRLGFGAGVDVRHLLMCSPDLYVFGNFDYLAVEIDEFAGTKYNPKAKDSLMRLGGGVQVNLLGGVKKRTTDRLYLKGQLGYAHYAADDDNTSSDNIGGMYFGGSLGVDHMFYGTGFGAFADTGIVYHYFFNSLGKGLDSVDMLAWEATAGFRYFF